MCLTRSFTALTLVAALAGPIPAQQPAAPAPPTDADFFAALAGMGLDEAVALAAAEPFADPEQAVARRDALVTGYLAALRHDHARWKRGLALVIGLNRRLLDEPDDDTDWRRPIWLADLAQKLQLDALHDRDMAGAFATLGAPSPAQREAVGLVAAASGDLLNEAEDEFFRLKASLGRRADFNEKYVNTGKWQRVRDYADRNIPYYRAWSVAYLCVQPDEGPYFAGKDAPAERRRMLADAAQEMRAVLDASAGGRWNDEAVARIRLVAALVDTQRGQPADALAHADAALKLKKATDFTRLSLKLARARALHRAGRDMQANKQLDALASDAFVTGHPLHMVLVADQRFAIRLDAARSLKDKNWRQKKIAESFAVYDQLLRHPKMKPWAEAVEPYLASRYSAQVPAGFAAAALPPGVRLAQVKEVFGRAERSRRDGRGDRGKLDYAAAAQLSGELLEAENLGRDHRADTLFIHGLSLLRSGQAGLAAKALTDMAERFPDRIEGEQAARVALLSVTGPLFAKSPDNPTVRRLHERAMGVLFEKYPSIDLAKTARYDYAAFLRQSQRYDEAVEAYGRVRRDHPAYVEALYEKAACLGALWDTSRSADRASETIRAVDAFVASAEKALRQRAGDRAARLKRHAASALLLKATVMLEGLDEPQRAAAVIDGIERRYPELVELKPRLGAMRIRVYQKLGDFAKADRTLTDLMKADPQRGGPLALGVLQSLNGEIRDLARQPGAAAKLNERVAIAVRLADTVVLPWAGRQARFKAEDRLAFALMPAEALRLAGRHDEAARRFEALTREYGAIAEKNLGVVTGSAECLYELERYDEARKHYTTLIRHAQSNNKYDATFWLAQARWYQMWDASLAGRTDAKLYRALVRLLERYKASPPPEPYRKTLLALREKHRNK